MKGVRKSASVPPPQHNLQDAARRALAAVCDQPPEQLEWLGARRANGGWTLAVLDDVLAVDLSDGAVRTSAGQEASPWWQVLALHYLSASARPAEEPPQVTFADLPSGLAYAPVYQQRVIERLCRTAGREKETLARAGRELGGTPVPAGDLAFDLRVFPRIRVRLIWYAGEEERSAGCRSGDLGPYLPPSAVLLLPGNIEDFLAVEDVVVLSERVVSRLSGGHF